MGTSLIFDPRGGVVVDILRHHPEIHLPILSSTCVAPNILKEIQEAGGKMSALPRGTRAIVKAHARSCGPCRAALGWGDI